MQPSSIPWDFVLILIVLGTLVPWRGAVRIKRLLAQPVLSPSERLSLYASTIFYQWLLVAVVAWRAFSRKLSSVDLGLTLSDPWRTFWIAAILTALLCTNQWASLRRMTKLPESQRGLLLQVAEKIMPRSFSEALLFAALACTAGLAEEFLYRGFVFTVFARWFAGSVISAPMAIILSSAWFGFGHLYQGRRGVITTFIVGVIFALVRLGGGSLIPATAAHAGIDLIAGLGAAKFLQAERA